MAPEMTLEEFEEWERSEREVIANEVKYAPLYAAMLGEKRISDARAALAKHREER